MRDDNWNAPKPDAPQKMVELTEQRYNTLTHCEELLESYMNRLAIAEADADRLARIVVSIPVEKDVSFAECEVALGKHCIALEMRK